MTKPTQLWNTRPAAQPDDGKAHGTVRKGKYRMKATRSLRFISNRSKQVSMGIVLVLATLLLHQNTAAEPIKVDLASGSDFAVLAGAGITVAGPVNSTVITGDIGTFPTTTISGLENVVLNGVNYAGGLETQNAKNDLTLAYNDAIGRTPDTVYGAIYDLGGSTLTSGVYNDPSSFAITGTLTLDAIGDPNAVWIFQVGSTLTTAVGSQVNLVNGAQAANVFWQVGSSATLGTDSSFAGSILALESITLNSGSDVTGRVLARNGAVSLLGNNTINAIPEPASALLIGLGGVMILVARRQLSRKKTEEGS